MADSLCLFGVCAGYGLSHLIDDRTVALWLLYICYVGDHLLFGAGMARTTYLSRITVRPEDLSPSLSLGVTINHVVSMSVPALGGLLWIRCGHPAVFLCAAGIAALMLVFSSLVRVDRQGTQAVPLQR